MRQWNGLPIFIMGASGTSKEVKGMIEDINALHQIDTYQIIAFVDIEAKEDINGVAVINEEMFYKKLMDFPVAGIVIPFGTPELKMKLYRQMTECINIVFPNIIHPCAVVSEMVTMGFGNIVAAGATISPNVNLGNFCLINNNCNIGHDTKLADFVVVNPLAAVSGNVTIGQGALIGGSSAILQGIEIGERARIGLGAFVVKDVLSDMTVVCEPAKVRKNEKR